MLVGTRAGVPEHRRGCARLDIGQGRTLRSAEQGKALMKKIEVEPLDSALFAPFGQLVQHDRKGVVSIVADAFERDETANTPCLSLIHIDAEVNFPLTVDRLERHPHSARTFLTLQGGRSLIVVCSSSANGSPIPETLRAFIAEPDQGICYRRNVWHHAASPLSAPTKYAMLMMLHPAGSDTEFHAFDEPVLVMV